MDDEYTCSISTHAITEGDIGQWNCDLQSFPFADVSLIYLLKVSCVNTFGNITRKRETRHYFQRNGQGYFC